MEITEVDFRYGADGGENISLTDAEKGEIVSMLHELEIDPEAGVDDTFFGGACCLALTVAENGKITVDFAESDRLYLAITRQHDSGSESLWYPVTDEVGSALYNYCKGIGERG